MSAIDPDLLNILVCPLTHASLVQVEDWLYSTDVATRRKYPIRDGLPIMLIDQSSVADPQEFERVMAEAKKMKQPAFQGV
ncbi:MAG: Trm112 family protein [Planctomycetota bacterium]